MFNVEEQVNLCKKRMSEWFENESGNAKGIVLGISGGKDSTVVSKLWAEVIGADKVFGVLMPNGEQRDIKDSIEVCKTIGIKYMTVNISSAFSGLLNAVKYNCSDTVFSVSSHTQTNVAPRIRMATLYLVAQELGYRVSGTGNASEAFVGYCTKWGDAACDFNPIASFTTDEVIAIGDYLGLPTHLTHKTPSDGLCGKSDEDNLGFTYEALNMYINSGTTGNIDVDAKIAKMNIYSRHKFDPIPTYQK